MGGGNDDEARLVLGEGWKDKHPKVGPRISDSLLLMGPPTCGNEFVSKEYGACMAMRGVEFLGELDLERNGLGIPLIGHEEVYTGVLGWDPYIPFGEVHFDLRANEVFACMDCE